MRGTVGGTASPYRLERVLKGSRERWISAGIAEEIAVGAVMENTVCGADGGLAILGGVPGEAYPRFKIPVFVVVEGTVAPGPTMSKVKGAGPLGSTERLEELLWTSNGTP